ncbi:hypothetical protein H8958_013667, partial [Nasalis larvatus]
VCALYTPATYDFELEGGWGPTSEVPSHVGIQARNSPQTTKETRGPPGGRLGSRVLGPIGASSATSISSSSANPAGTRPTCLGEGQSVRTMARQASRKSQTHPRKTRGLASLQFFVFQWSGVTSGGCPMTGKGAKKQRVGLEAAANPEPSGEQGTRQGRAQDSQGHGGDKGRQGQHPPGHDHEGSLGRERSLSIARRPGPQEEALEDAWQEMETPAGACRGHWEPAGNRQLEWEWLLGQGSDTQTSGGPG